MKYISIKAQYPNGCESRRNALPPYFPAAKINRFLNPYTIIPNAAEANIAITMQTTLPNIKT